MEFHTPASVPPETKETICIPLIQIENPFYGKPYISAYEAIEIINSLSNSLKEIEKSRGIDG